MFLISNWNAKGVRKVASGITGAVDLDIQSRWQTNRILGGIPASNFFQQPKNRLCMNITESNAIVKLTVYYARNYEGILFNKFKKTSGSECDRDDELFVKFQLRLKKATNIIKVPSQQDAYVNTQWK